MSLIPRLTERARLRGIVDDLRLGHDWTLDELISELAAQRKKKFNRLLAFQVLPYGSLPPKTCALWIAMPPRTDENGVEHLGVDVLLHEEKTSEPQYSQQLLCHELGHVFCDPPDRSIEVRLADADLADADLSSTELSPLLKTVNTALSPEFGQIDESMVRARRTQRGYKDKRERLAEFFGTLLAALAWPNDVEPRSLELAAFALGPQASVTDHVGG